MTFDPKKYEALINDYFEALNSEIADLERSFTELLDEANKERNTDHEK